jgi:hypothetical protein
MAGKILLSTAYLPSIEYFSHILNADEVLIEREENYLKQSYRNRCYILSPGGKLSLTVPVYQGSFHKTPVKEIRIDYTKRWQQVHLGALTASYSSSPFFLYYFEIIEKIILSRPEYLLDLNTELLRALMKMFGSKACVSYTIDFKPAERIREDLRYSISPKRNSLYRARQYLQVFGCEIGFVPGLSIVDLLFNTGPEALLYI